MSQQGILQPLKQHGIQNRKNIIHKLTWGDLNKLHPARSKIQGLYLIAHHETGQRAPIRYLDMEWNLAVRIGDRTTDRHTRALVKDLLAEDQCRPPASLFMARLRVKVQRHQIALLGDVQSHLPDLTSTRFTEEFLCLVVSRHLRYQILDPMPPAADDCFLSWLHDD